MFIRAFRRKQITDKTYLQNLIVYIHQNPVNAGFCLKPEGLKYSSYNALMGDALTMLSRKEAIALFENKENFTFCNGKVVDMDFD